MAHYEDEVHELSRVKAETLSPVIVIVALLMIIGLFGNPLVVYFYGFRMKHTASYMFIVSIAVFDLMSCLISMPLEIVDMVQFYTFENGTACRTFRFVNYFASISSGFALIAVAVDRFRKLCRPFDRQISVKMAKVIIVCCVGVSIFCSWPSLVIYDVVKVNITDHPNVTGFDCTTIREEEYRKYITVYNIFLFLLFVIAIVALVVLYCLVGKQLFQLRSFRFYATKRKSSAKTSVVTSQTVGSDVYTNSEEKKSSDDGFKQHGITINVEEGNENGGFNDLDRPRSTTSIRFIKDGPLKVGPEDLHRQETTMTDVSETSLGVTNNNDGNVKIGSTFSTDTSRASTTEMPESETRCANGTQGIDDKKMAAQNINTRKYTIITISITVGFILSFLPYLILTTWRTLSKEYEVNVLSGFGLIAFQLFIRSYLFSSVCNPLIYGFLNTEFKHMVTETIKRICCKCCCWANANDTSRHKTSGRSASST